MLKNVENLGNLEHLIETCINKLNGKLILDFLNVGESKIVDGKKSEESF